MEYSVEIIGSTVNLRDGAKTIRSFPLSEFAERLVQMSDRTVFDDPLPDGVRFVRARGDVTLVVLEIPPQYRTVRWLDDSSLVPYGPGAVYRQVRLAFPYIVLIMVFVGGDIRGYQQLYYRTEPIRSIDDGLLLPNIRNCHPYEDMQCILCLGHRDVESVAHLPWHEKINRVVELLWFRGFNKSPEAVRRPSYWTMMQKLDERISTVDAWAAASMHDRLFPLQVKWKPASSTIREVMENMLETHSHGVNVIDIDDLYYVLCHCESLEI